MEFEVLKAMGEVNGSRVLDIGCGNGRYARALKSRGAQVVTMDLSRGMLASLNQLPAKVCADAEFLPLRQNSVDQVLSAHMLYHLAHPQAAIAEFSRVLTPSGTVVVTSNTDQHLVEARDLWSNLLQAVGLDANSPDLSFANIELPVNVLLDYMRANFASVQTQLLTSTVRLEDPEPLVHYAATTTSARATADLGFDLLPQFRRQLAMHIARAGIIEITTEVIVIVAREPPSSAHRSWTGRAGEA